MKEKVWPALFLHKNTAWCAMQFSLPGTCGTWWLHWDCHSYAVLWLHGRPFKQLAAGCFLCFFSGQMLQNNIGLIPGCFRFLNSCLTCFYMPGDPALSLTPVRLQAAIGHQDGTFEGKVEDHESAGRFSFSMDRFVAVVRVRCFVVAGLSIRSPLSGRDGGLTCNLWICVTIWL